MQNFVLVGTTGVGKSYLELQLEKNYGFYPWPKYTDRVEKRNDETTASNIKFVSKEEFDNMYPDFLFTSVYLGNRYGWRRDDYVNNLQRNITVAIPLDSLVSFVARVPKFMPILLNIDINNFMLVENRIKSRENFANITPDEQNILTNKIQERLVVARYESEKFPFYKKLVERYGGKIFTIKDDNTIFQEVIPFILQNREEVHKKRNFMDIAKKYN